MSNAVLLDIFSYSCMNCLRSIENIKKIDRKYRKFGLKTIIIHAPEWGFEKSSKNITHALKKHNINIPVIIDKNKKITKKFGVNFWPAQILFGGGKIQYKHVGEGNYKELENNIIKILRIKPGKIFHKEPKFTKFPAIYCGKKKAGKIHKLGGDLKFGIVYAGNNWVQKNEYIQSLKDGSLLEILAKGSIISFVSQSLNKKPLKVGIKLNGKGISSIYVKNPKLYRIAELKKNAGNNKLTLKTNKNLAIYSFSFQ